MCTCCTQLSDSSFASNYWIQTCSKTHKVGKQLKWNHSQKEATDVAKIYWIPHRIPNSYMQSVVIITNSDIIANFRWSMLSYFSFVYEKNNKISSLEKDCFKVSRLRICLNNLIMVVMPHLLSKTNSLIFNLYNVSFLCLCEQNILIHLTLTLKFCTNFKNFNSFSK